MLGGLLFPVAQSSQSSPHKALSQCSDSHRFSPAVDTQMAKGLSLGLSCCSHTHTATGHSNSGCSTAKGLSVAQSSGSLLWVQTPQGQALSFLGKTQTIHMSAQLLSQDTATLCGSVSQLSGYSKHSSRFTPSGSCTALLEPLFPAKSY